MNAATPAAVPDVAAAGAATAPAAPAPAAAPAVSPQYTPPPSNLPPAMADGGDVGGSSARKNPFKDFFADVNIVDVAISAFIVGAVIYSIQYHKFMMMMEKTGYADLSTRLNRVENDLATAKRKATEANATGGRFMRKKRALVTL